MLTIESVESLDNKCQRKDNDLKMNGKGRGVGVRDIIGVFVYDVE